MNSFCNTVFVIVMQIKLIVVVVRISKLELLAPEVLIDNLLSNSHQLLMLAYVSLQLIGW